MKKLFLAILMVIIMTTTVYGIELKTKGVYLCDTQDGYHLVVIQGEWYAVKYHQDYPLYQYDIVEIVFSLNDKDQIVNVEIK